MDLGILVPLAPFIMVIVIVILGAWQKSRAQREVQTTLRASIEKGIPLPPDVIEAMSSEIHRPVSAARDVRLGVILLSVSIGVVITGAVLGHLAEEAAYGIGAFAAIPGAIGVAFIILSFFNKNKG